MISPEKLDSLQRSWVQLLTPMGVTWEAAYAEFDRLVVCYSEPHRYFHTLEHIGEMLKIAGKLGHGLPQRLELMLAVWYHDVAYDPRATDNEARSAVAASKSLGELGLESHAIDVVQELILSTRHGAPPASTLPVVDVLHDADLAILGAADVRYARYAIDIRREYAHVSDAEYKHGRTALLQEFLSQPAIYRTAWLLAEGEERARSNIETELRSL